MAGLLNLVPRYLPRYGMAPRVGARRAAAGARLHGDRLRRHLVFDAERRRAGRRLRDRRAGADDLGLRRRDPVRPPRSGSRAAVRLRAWSRAVFVYTTVVNIVERPDGVKIGALLHPRASWSSRSSRGSAGRSSCAATGITFDEAAEQFLADAARVRHAAPRRATSPTTATPTSTATRCAEVRRDNDIPKWAPLVFLEVTVSDASDFETDLDVHGEERFGYRVLTRARARSCANTIAAVLLASRDRTGQRAARLLQLDRGQPRAQPAAVPFVGAGEIAPVTREVLREAEQVPEHRPKVHVS